MCKIQVVKYTKCTKIVRYLNIMQIQTSLIIIYYYI